MNSNQVRQLRPGQMPKASEWNALVASAQATNPQQNGYTTPTGHTFKRENKHVRKTTMFYTKTEIPPYSVFATKAHGLVDGVPALEAVRLEDTNETDTYEDYIGTNCESSIQAGGVFYGYIVDDTHDDLIEIENASNTSTHCGLVRNKWKADADEYGLWITGHYRDNLYYVRKDEGMPSEVFGTLNDAWEQGDETAHITLDEGFSVLGATQIEAYASPTLPESLDAETPVTCRYIKAKAKWFFFKPAGGNNDPVTVYFDGIHRSHYLHTGDGYVLLPKLNCDTSKLDSYLNIPLYGTYNIVEKVDVPYFQPMGYPYRECYIDAGRHFWDSTVVETLVNTDGDYCDMYHYTGTGYHFLRELHPYGEDSDISVYKKSTIQILETIENVNIHELANFDTNTTSYSVQVEMAENIVGDKTYWTGTGNLSGGMTPCTFISLENISNLYTLSYSYDARYIHTYEIDHDFAITTTQDEYTISDAYIHGFEATTQWGGNIYLYLWGKSKPKKRGTCIIEGEGANFEMVYSVETDSKERRKSHTTVFQLPVKRQYNRHVAPPRLETVDVTYSLVGGYLKRDNTGKSGYYAQSDYGPKPFLYTFSALVSQNVTLEYIPGDASLTFNLYKFLKNTEGVLIHNRDNMYIYSEDGIDGKRFRDGFLQTQLAFGYEEETQNGTRWTPEETFTIQDVFDDDGSIEHTPHKWLQREYNNRHETLLVKIGQWKPATSTNCAQIVNNGCWNISNNNGNVPVIKRENLVFEPDIRNARDTFNSNSIQDQWNIHAKAVIFDLYRTGNQFQDDTTGNDTEVE